VAYKTNFESISTIRTVLFAASLLSIYEKVPDKFTPLLPRFLQMVQVVGIEATIVMQLFGEVAKRSPEVLFMSFAPDLRATLSFFPSCTTVIQCKTITDSKTVLLRHYYGRRFKKSFSLMFFFCFALLVLCSKLPVSTGSLLRILQAITPRRISSGYVVK